MQGAKINNLFKIDEKYFCKIFYGKNTLLLATIIHMKTSWYFFIIFFAVALATGTSSCKKVNNLSTGHLDFSTDTLVFDTVFTTVGSTTKSFKFYNNDSKPINIDEIELMGGNTSPYRINVDGVSGIFHEDIVVEAGDSLFVFVEVTLDPNNLSNPLVIEDSIRFETNGLHQYVVLAAWGQDAYFYHNEVVSGVWNDDKPHVIYGAAAVGYPALDSGLNLTINAGTQVHLHKGAYLMVYKSTLTIAGAINDEVVFQGDRLEMEYDDVAGQYHGIYFHHALPSTINYAIIKNGIAGIHVFNEHASNGNTPTVNVTNTVIQNCASYGMFIYAGGHLSGYNNIVAKNGIHSLLILGGGDFDFTNSDFLGYGSGQNSTIGINNHFYDQNLGGIINMPIYGRMNNCVIYGNQEQEIAIDTLENSGQVVDIKFQQNLIRSLELPDASDPFYDTGSFPNIFNQDPLFSDIVTYDFTYPGNSPIKNAGNLSLSQTAGCITDILNNPRVSLVDLGPYNLP